MLNIHLKILVLNKGLIEISLLPVACLEARKEGRKENSFSP